VKDRAFLFINISGDFLSLHQKIEAEGYTCFSWFSKECLKGKGETGKHLIKREEDLFDILVKYKDNKQKLIILIDDNSQGDLCDYLRSEGWKVIGSSHFADEMEHERADGNKLAEDIGLKVPPTKSFTDFKTAIDYLQKIEAKYGDVKFVFKGDGVDLAGSSKTYLAKTIADMIWYIQWIDKDQAIHNYHVDKFELQMVIDGIEADFASWFNGERFIPAMTVTFEQKKVHGLGAAEGCTGQVCFFVDPTKEKFYKDYTSKLLPHIKGTGANEWAANNIISEKERLPYFLEWTPRFGWDSTFGELSLLLDAGRSIGDFFIKIADKQPFPKDYFPYHRYSAAVRLYSENMGRKGEDVKGKPIMWNKKYDKNFWWYGIRGRDDGRYEITDNPIGVATAIGDSIEEAIKNVYDLIKPDNGILVTPDLFYSEHIGEGVQDAKDRLQNMGFLHTP
jgi:phosphoribosylamine-glycine ligase